MSQRGERERGAGPLIGNLPLIKRLQNIFEAELSRVAGERCEYAVLDFPNHSNIGDSAIYVGEAIALKKLHGCPPFVVTGSDARELDAVAGLHPDAPIFLHGGGNFGDLWPRHQFFREAVLARFPDRRVVQFPQSIHFDDKANLERAAAVISGHRNFTLMVRDEASAATARAWFDCDVRMVPDAAFMIGAIGQPEAPDRKVVCIIRQDKETRLESTTELDLLPQPSLVADWPAEHLPNNLIDRVSRRLRRWLPGSDRPASPGHYERLARKRLQRGLRLLCRGEVVLTDRLHAHILSVLLGKPHVTLDNSYGKIKNFVAAFTSEANVLQAANLSEAIQIASSIVNNSSDRARPVGFGDR